MDTREKTHDEHDELSPKERYDMKKRERQEAKRATAGGAGRSRAGKRAAGWLITIALTALVIGIVIWALLRVPVLPPTSVQNHVEAIPESHILTEPMPDRVQRHMLEHADGAGLPGIIIQYNCEDFACEPDLVEKLTALAEEYPDRVYLAPNRYDGKIILTKLGRREILDGLDEARIRDFIK